MEPTRETDDALNELEKYGDHTLRGDIQRLTGEAKQLVPDLVGVSLGLVVEGLMLTYVASNEETAALDGVQYADHGPCVDAVTLGEQIRTNEESLLDEKRWQLFAQASAARGIRSSLSMPFVSNGVVTGGVNLYGAGPDTFDGQAERLGALFGAWVPGAVTNADLSFLTRRQAAESVTNLRDSAQLDQAVGILMATGASGPEQAEECLRDAAGRAGIPVSVLARAVIDASSPSGSAAATPDDQRE